uniref:TRAF-type domain-containing protein n=1 Tax=Elaeophora elaphi TaxID=1147741 RepID=A0A158Q8L2_9BILA
MSVITDDKYMGAVQKTFNEKLKQFQEAGGWDVVNEKAQHCTYHRYLEVGIEDCENAAKLIESLMVTLEAVKRELRAEVERLEARQFERTNFTKMVEVINSAMKRKENISESCTNMNIDGRQIEEMNQVIALSSSSIDSLEAQVSGLQITPSTSTINQNSAFKQAQRISAKALVEKLYRPPTSLTGSFTVDEDEETATFLEPMRILTFQDTTMDDIERSKGNLDQMTNSSKKENVEPVHISESPVMESELVKQWIREVSFKQIQRRPTETVVEKLYRPPASLKGSFTVDEDEDTATFLEPMRVLTFQDATMDDIVRGKGNLDQITDSLKKDVGSVHISQSPVIKSELAKQWIREVTLKQDQNKDAVTFPESVDVLTSHDTTVDDTVRGKGNLDQMNKSLEKKDVEPVRIPEPPVMESELAKQWIREVARQMF